MNDAYLSHLREAVDGIRADGFYKAERVTASPQSPLIRLAEFLRLKPRKPLRQQQSPHSLSW